MERAIVWLDVEANGLSPELHTLLEVGAKVTNFRGEPISEPYSALVTVPNLKDVIDQANPLVRRMHDRSKLWQALWEEDSKPTELIDSELVSLVESLPEPAALFLGGNSIWRDRGFVSAHLPRFSARLSHMSVDGTTLSTVLQEIRGAHQYNKKHQHRALPDVLDSIEEYRFYIHSMVCETV